MPQQDSKRRGICACTRQNGEEKTLVSSINLCGIQVSGRLDVWIVSLQSGGSRNSQQLVIGRDKNERSQIRFNQQAVYHERRSQLHSIVRPERVLVEQFSS